MEDALTERSILIVEDDPEHLRIIQTVFAQRAVQSQVVALVDGSVALRYLRQQAEFADAARPDLIVLDLNLPEPAAKDGWEVLAELKSDPSLRRIPVVVLTSATADADITRTYTLQGNCHVIKSGDLDHLTQIVQRIEEFWLGIVTLPLE